MMWRQAAFCGIEIVTYAMMANHFHVLARVPEPVELSDGQLLERLQAFYGRGGFLTLLAQENIKQTGRIDARLRQRLVARMGNVSVFQPTLRRC